MKALLLVLSGDAERAHSWLAENYPAANVQPLSRSELESANAAQRLRLGRQQRPDILVMVTERLQWQRGQNALFAFGALAGARRVVMIDSRGALRNESRRQILTRTPALITKESVASAAAVRESRARLKQLEREVAARPNLKINPNSSQISIAYLRSTPSPGSHAGGAATHINGFINAASEQGARVHMISNDYIAGLDEQRMILVDPEPVGSTRAAFDLRNNLIFTAGVLK